MSDTVETPAHVIRLRMSRSAQAVVKGAFLAVSLVCLMASVFFADANASKQTTASLATMTLQAVALRTGAPVGADRVVRIAEARR